MRYRKDSPIIICGRYIKFIILHSRLLCILIWTIINCYYTLCCLCWNLVSWRRYISHSVEDAMFNSFWLRLVEWNISSFTSWNGLYHCTYNHSLFVCCFPDSRFCYSCRIWNLIAYFKDFTVRYGLKQKQKQTNKNSMNEVYIDWSFIRDMVDNYCP